MNPPVRVFIEGSELVGYTNLRLRRAKSELTGQVDITVFMGYLPTEPVSPQATAGREILVYVGGHLAFTGNLDRRTDTGSKEGEAGGGTIKVSADSYTVTFSARGKTKYLIESSHQHPTGTLLKPTSRSTMEELLKPFQPSVQWEAEDLQLDKIRFRDGGRVVDELHKVAEMCGVFIHETRDGNLKVTDGTQPPATGEPIILGQNILSFQTEQAEDEQRSEVVVKGQRIEKEVWGNEAVLPTMKQVADSAVSSFSPLTVQVYGNATEEVLEKRAKYEMNKRNAEGKKITVDVFHVQQSSGEPWDIGTIHQVSIPPAGVSGSFEVVELTYNVVASGELYTSLTLSPPATSTGGGGGGFMGGVSAQGANDGEWSGPNVVPKALDINTVTGVTTTETSKLSYGAAVPTFGDIGTSTPPLTIPDGT